LSILNKFLYVYGQNKIDQRRVDESCKFLASKNYYVKSYICLWIFYLSVGVYTAEYAILY